MKKKIKIVYMIYQKYFSNLVTGDEIWVYNFEPKHKSSKRIWASKNVKRLSIAKRVGSVKKVLCVIF